MFKLIIASHNVGKVNEIKYLLADLPIKILSSLDGFTIPTATEDGATFEENALNKARGGAKATGLCTLADDSGLLIDALDGAPGLHSSRYFGPGLTDSDKLHKLLHLLERVPDQARSARFYCAAALVVPGYRFWLTNGTCEGRIIKKPLGLDGFGYDPIFLIPHLEKTFAQLTIGEKSRLSHRAKAVEKMKDIIQALALKQSLTGG